MFPECPKNGCLGDSFLLYPRESDPEVVQGPGSLTMLSTLLGTVLRAEPAKLTWVAETVKFFESTCRSGDPASLPRIKRV